MIPVGDSPPTAGTASNAFPARQFGLNCPSLGGCGGTSFIRITDGSDSVELVTRCLRCGCWRSARPSRAWSRAFRGLPLRWSPWRSGCGASIPPWPRSWRCSAAGPARSSPSFASAVAGTSRLLWPFVLGSAIGIPIGTSCCRCSTPIASSWCWVPCWWCAARPCWPRRACRALPTAAAWPTPVVGLLGGVMAPLSGFSGLAPALWCTLARLHQGRAPRGAAELQPDRAVGDAGVAGVVGPRACRPVAANGRGRRLADHPVDLRLEDLHRHEPDRVPRRRAVAAGLCRRGHAGVGAEDDARARRRRGESGYRLIALAIASTVNFVRNSTIFFPISSVLLIGSRLTPLMVARLALVRSSMRIVFGS